MKRKRLILTLDIVFYNMRVGRPQDQAITEIHAILSTKPDVLGLCEAVTYRLPEIPGYTLIRDTSTVSRANIAVYVRNDLRVRRVRWHDLTETWGRTQHPGEHPSRSFVSLRVDGVQVIVAHQPPKGTDNTVPAQREGINAFVSLMAPWIKAPVRRALARRRPRVLIMDANRTVGEAGPGPSDLARQIGGAAVGGRIDTAVVRNATATDVRYPKSIGGVRLKSDHDHALRFRLAY